MMIASRWIFTCVTTLVLTEFGQVLPRTTIIRGASPCATCRIELEKVITLGGATEAEGLVGGGPWLATDSRGRYYVGPTATGGQVLVFGTDEAGASIVEAQTPIKKIRHSVACPSCRVEFVQLAVLGKKNDKARIALNSRLRQDSKGRFIAFSDEFQLLVFDPNGNLVAAKGRKGEGPGEFDARNRSVPLFDVGRGDTIFVADGPTIKVFSPNLDFIRQVPIPFRPALSFFALDDGSWIAGGASGHRSLIGRHIHSLNPKGDVRRSIGPEFKVVPFEPNVPSVEFLLSLDRRSIWFQDRYSVQQWSLNDSPLSLFEVTNVPFLPAPTIVTRQGRSGPYRDAVNGGTSFLTGIDTLGQLWLFGRPPRQGMPSRDSIRPGILEVVNPTTGSVVSSQSVATPMLLLEGGRLAYSGKLDDDATFSIVIWKYRMAVR